ncbi:MAG: hypothetical protein JXA15_03295 [Spirochaetales bacterium]|nr:hypothetical protein [Spirochaetales bacterium]
MDENEKIDEPLETGSDGVNAAKGEAGSSGANPVASPEAGADAAREAPDEAAAPGGSEARLEAASPDAPDAETDAEAASPAATGAETPDAAPTAAGGKAQGRSRHEKKKIPFLIRLLLGLVKAVLVVALVVVLAAALLVAWSSLNRQNPLSALPDGFDAYVRVESASALLTELVELEVADLVLASPELAGARAAVTALRASGILDSPLLRTLADVRLDAALYGKGDFLAVARLGWRSAATRLAMAAGPLAVRAAEYAELDGLSFERSGGPARFVYSPPGPAGQARMSIHAAGRGDLLVIASSAALLEGALERTRRLAGQKELEEALERPAEGSIRFLARSEAWLSGLRSSKDPLALMLAALSFPDYASVDVTVTNASIEITAAAPVRSDDADLASLVDSRSGAPAIVSLYPSSLRWASVVALGSPEALLDIAGPRLGPSFADTLEQADGALELAFGKNLEELVFSWAGGELGALGVGEGAAPVYFLRVSDERERKRAFDAIFGSILANEGATVLVNDVELTRIDLPWYLESILAAAGARLPEPWFFVDEGFIFLSTSPEPLGELGRSIRSGELLVRTERWKRSGGAVPAAAAVQVVYSLEDAVPFFLRTAGPVAEALRRYGDGVATVRFDGGTIRVALAARASGGRGVTSVPGFPVQAEGRIDSGALALSVRGSPTRLYWIEDGDTLVEYTPADGVRREASLDDRANLAIEEGAAVWAVSGRGAVYRFTPGLEATPGFPVATGLSPSAPPALGPGGLLLPVKDPDGILAVDRSGTTGLLAPWLEASLLSPPAARADAMAFYPKRFDGLVHLTGPDGAELGGWPIEAPGLGYGSPFFVPEGKGYGVGFLSQSGELVVWPSTGFVREPGAAAPDPSAPAAGMTPRDIPGTRAWLLDGVFFSGAVHAPLSGHIWAIAEDGRVWRVAPDGSVSSLSADDAEAGTGSRFPRGKEARLMLRDVDGDGLEEAFVYGAGGAVGGIDHDLSPLAGFPLPGGREPSFADLDGDGRVELVSAGFDGAVRAWRFPK